MRGRSSSSAESAETDDSLLRWYGSVRPEDAEFDCHPRLGREADRDAHLVVPLDDIEVEGRTAPALLLLQSRASLSNASRLTS